MLGPCARLLEDTPQLRLALAVELVDDLGAAQTEELGIGLVGDGARDQGLAASGRPVQQDAFRRIDSEPFEHFG